MHTIISAFSLRRRKSTPQRTCQCGALISRDSDTGMCRLCFTGRRPSGRVQMDHSIRVGMRVEWTPRNVKDGVHRRRGVVTAMAALRAIYRCEDTGRSYVAAFDSLRVLDAA